MDEESRMRIILKSVEDEAHQLLVVNQRRDYGDVEVQLYNVAWSHFNSEFDNHEAYRDRVVDATKRIIDDLIVIAGIS